MIEIMELADILKHVNLLKIRKRNKNEQEKNGRYEISHIKHWVMKRVSEVKINIIRDTAEERIVSFKA